MKQKAIIWGATYSAKTNIEKIESNYEVLGFIDNDKQKMGETLFKKKIYAPEYIIKNKDFIDIVFILSISGCESIVKQLNEMGINNSKINTDFVKTKVYPRIKFLKSLSKLFLDKGIKGATAEVGVFQGDFAKYINEFFSNGKLYLFDTFRGFNEKDLVYEEIYNLSRSIKGHLSNTSVDLVLSKMSRPENVEIIEGYFPESLKDLIIEDNFLFVNLDVDLYKPTYEALKYFSSKLNNQGVILIHDYFNDGYLGVKKAVDEFLDINKNYSSFPIGDFCSIALVKLNNNFIKEIL